MWFSEDRSHWNRKDIRLWCGSPALLYLFVLFLPLLQSTAWAQHYRMRMQRSKWEAPHRFNHAARISDLCKELLIYDTSCQRGRFWNNKCLRQRRARIHLVVFFFPWVFLFLYLCLLPIHHKSHDRASWQSNVSLNPAGFFQTSQQRSMRRENTIDSVFSGGEQPICFRSALTRAGCDKVLLKKEIQLLYQQIVLHCISQT